MCLSSRACWVLSYQEQLPPWLHASGPRFTCDYLAPAHLCSASAARWEAIEKDGLKIGSIKDGQVVHQPLHGLHDDSGEDMHVLVTA